MYPRTTSPKSSACRRTYYHLPHEPQAPGYSSKRTIPPAFYSPTIPRICLLPLCAATVKIHRAPFKTSTWPITRSTWKTYKRQLDTEHMKPSELRMSSNHGNFIWNQLVAHHVLKGLIHPAAISEMRRDLVVHESDIQLIQLLRA